MSLLTCRVSEFLRLDESVLNGFSFDDLAFDPSLTGLLSNRRAGSDAVELIRGIELIALAPGCSSFDWAEVELELDWRCAAEKGRVIIADATLKRDDGERGKGARDE